ncbi:MAG: 7-cyano-7-deazaguanine synthase, partial [Candidatus Marinimicrobia bacterium]|nr:7-cyano-7-deazaguanine synthase [Candidatus Neomarinimicrobiota bacterium]
MQKAVVVLSGGMDSTTLLYDVLKQGFEVSAVSFDYNQKHKKELQMAKETCNSLNVPHKIISLSVLNDIAPSA